ncbi:3'-5' exoribonuclease HELZ2 [Hoplias malabaricus]|uniref:3'-5' exoribonuclease HELZ2 n=1 Tax=Hoplias malabaricus TaxID=27720 RepID=UPI0034625978
MATNKTKTLPGNHDFHLLLQTHDLFLRCSQCCRAKTDISYSLVDLAHKCSKDIILVKLKGNNIKWNIVAKRPKFPQPLKYEVCWHYREGNGCTVHGNRCSFARSKEEAAVWNFMKKTSLEYHQLINLLLNGPTFLPSQESALASSSGDISVVQGILSNFQGSFIELCKLCFYDNPRKISFRENGSCCAGHKWSPLLVFCQKGEQKKVVYDEIRPLPKNRMLQWKYCKYVEKGDPCWHGSHRCWFAHSRIEMTVWESESSGSLDRSHLLQASQRQQPQSSGTGSRAASQERKRQHHCLVCNCHFPTNEEFMNHCFTAKHRKLIFEDAPFTWKYRDPPLTSKTFKLCERKATCEYGDSCMDAHSTEELQEWQYRHKATRKKIRAAEQQGLLSYQDSLLEEYRESKNKQMIMSETLPGVSVSCDSDLSTTVRRENIAHRWKFTIESKVHLDVVALLRQDVGARFALGEDRNEQRSYSHGIWFETKDMPNARKVYEIIVSFTSDHPGFYEQWLVFDFDMGRPVLLQKLQVRVGDQLFQNTGRHQQSIVSTNATLEADRAQCSEKVWQEGTVEIIPYLMRTVGEQELLKRYRSTKWHLSTEPTGLGSITQQNYREKMHSFLYKEEMEESQLVRRLNLRGKMFLTKCLYEPWFGTKYAIPGELFGSVTVSRSLTPDTLEGYMLKRHVQMVLVGQPKAEGDIQRVYEAKVLKDTIGETQVHLQLPNICCTELNFQCDTTVEMEFQFQLDRIWFCEMHKAVDILPDLTRVLPELSDNNIPVSNNTSSSELNEKQQAAMDFILGLSEHKSNAAPLLIYGPFGTGKTFTLAKITLALAMNPRNKILICTHTNSSADLYVKDHFHISVMTAKHPTRPLRIKAKEINLRTTESITLQYCHLSKDGFSFEFPDRERVDAARIIITTTTMARLFHDMQLPSNYFSHIFIDEASQMLECEALMALGLAGEKTRVVLAGDHMQMGPKVVSVGEDKRSDHTLLNRLFHYYQKENTTTARNSRIIFSENYRSTEEIVDFVSTHFYVGKKDVIKAKGNVPCHPKQNAIQFYHIRGECHLDKFSLTWFNLAQIQNVVDVVQKVLREWPEEWQKMDPAAVCVLSQGSQVFEIRKTLKQYQLYNVTVENAENVQGKQFRVIIISTVHTKDSLSVTEQTCLEFFNDMRLLNTAMTRAQSQVIVVGDATALCCSHFGKCWRLWRSYIKHCIDKGSIHPEDFTLENVNQELLVITNMIKTEDDDSSDDESITSEVPTVDEDPILKELLNEDNELQIQLTEDGLFPVLQNDNLHKNVVRHVRERDVPRPQPDTMWQDNPNMYKCELVLERYDLGYAKPFNKPTLRIEIKGRKNLGRTFSGDVVIVEILTSETFPPKGKVIEVHQHAEFCKRFVCIIDNNDNQLMTPINICIPKFYTPFWKDRPHHIAVRNPKNWNVEKFVKINEEARRNNLFVVKFLKWREGFSYPLGIVVQVLPKVASLEDGLKVLDIEYQLKQTVPPLVQEEMNSIQKIPLFTNGREDFSELMMFTIDGSSSQDLDDAISVRKLGKHYEIGIHIADVASFVAKDSELDKYARQQGTAFYVSEGEPTYMFPKDMSTKEFSLLPNCKRRCISLMIEVDMQTHQIQKTTFYKSVICSKKKLSYEDAEELLRTSGNKYDFNTLEGCLAIACFFADVHRKWRKQSDWCYKSPDEDVVVGRRRSHRLVEELMILFNHTVADYLLLHDRTMSLTPLRCQDKPNQELLQRFLDKNVSLFPMSIHLSSQFDRKSEAAQVDDLSVMQQSNANKKETPIFDSKYFPILISVLKNLKIAAQDKDIDRIIDLITTDDIHPLLLPLTINLRRILNKSYILRANSTHLSRLGHYDLELDSYTWASSPIRRYVDVIVQRLLHSVIEDTKIEYSPLEVDHCCVDFTQKSNSQSACQKKSYALNLASKLSSENAKKVAYIVEINPTGNNFRISFPLIRDSLPDMVGIMYRDLQLADQPKYDEENDCMVLKWVRRVYSFSSPSIHTELKQQENNSVITHVPTEYWKLLVSAIREKQCDLLVQMTEQMDLTVHTQKAVRKKTQMPAAASRMEMPKQRDEHFIEMSMKLKQGNILEVQLGTDTARGLLVPAVQLLIVNPKFEICLEHTKNPVMCFSKYALCSTRESYSTYMDYQKIWKPLCEMESACSAVAENESIVIEDVALKWKTVKEHLEGSFCLPFEKKAQWAIDGNLKSGFLCIRMRIQQKDPGPILQDMLSNSEDLSLMDVPGLIWIAHGIVKNVSVHEDSEELGYFEIEFHINHLPMTTVPEQIFSKGASFTVELIPKLLPDVRKENAIDNLTTANQLVKAIATGKNTKDNRTTIKACGRSRFEIQNHCSFGFNLLNNSQCAAIRKALNNEFTIIQGPPGTGKTVVGVHIAYWFFQENQKLPPLQNNENKEPKKRCILYCGPSNKSVDVVAGQLLKLQGKLNPLRVYSDQMEIQEFPYPGSNLKLSRHSQRGEKPKKELRPITLHHRIRMASNPFSTQIQAFDLKIQREQYLTNEEMKSYKQCLKEAREHELMQHSIILCTCTAASHPLLAKVLNFTQIIIDECAMATEPEAFIPLVKHRPKQIVLLGDHKQLQPVVNCDLVQRLGMRRSLFERYMRKALMLDTQYRMQEDICAFPSQEFYEGKLKTGIPYKSSVFLNRSNYTTSIIFGHVEGNELSLVVSTERGNENSKANVEEATEAMRIARSLIRSGIKSNEIAILTPYNAQVAKINEVLFKSNIENITVNTIMKSQGSEWRYVILSTVRSCTLSDIELQPTKAWLIKNLGFVMDPHQVNVGITRAQEGLCIVGNRNLLQRSYLWRRLLKHYEDKGCVVDPARNIQISLA